MPVSKKKVSDVDCSVPEASFLSPDGISYSFDPRANGYGRGEGVAAIILKALPRALRDGDPIRLVVRETALNQDGRTPAITGPSPEAQACLIRECYQKAGLDPRQTSYVEAHGTGTPTGDPLELAAISAAFQGQPLQIGSVKANLGHTEAASGLASVMKVALALEKGIVPPSARFLQPSKKLLEERKFQVTLPLSISRLDLDTQLTHHHTCRFPYLANCGFRLTEFVAHRSTTSASEARMLMQSWSGMTPLREYRRASQTVISGLTTAMWKQIEGKSMF